MYLQKELSTIFRVAGMSPTHTMDADERDICANCSQQTVLVRGTLTHDQPGGASNSYTERTIGLEGSGKEQKWWV